MQPSEFASFALSLPLGSRCRLIEGLCRDSKVVERTFNDMEDGTRSHQKYSIDIGIV
jgi:hypothetical protein